MLLTMKPAKFRGPPDSPEANFVAPTPSYRATHVRFTESDLFRYSLLDEAVVPEADRRPGPGHAPGANRRLGFLHGSPSKARVPDAVHKGRKLEAIRSKTGSC